MTRALLALALLVALGSCGKDETGAGARAAPALARAISDVEAAKADAATPPPVPDRAAMDAKARTEAPAT
jgi:hypothetical protein